MVFPQPAPARRSLARAPRHDRMVAWGRLPRRIRAGRQGMRGLGGTTAHRGRTHDAEPATGPRRRLTSVKVALAPLIDLAHRRGGTVNDLVLTAVSGAVGTLLLRRYCAVVNTATGAWCRFMGYDATCFMQLAGDLFFGTQDGIVMQCERTGYDDGKPYVCTMIGAWGPRPSRIFM